MEFVGDKTVEEVFAVYNALNADVSHMASRDDICTPMECVKLMIDYIPTELWNRDSVRVLDACCGNGNFGAYCQYKTDINNIYFNDINSQRLNNCRTLLKPKNLLQLDVLSMLDYDQWDLIMSNPPYSGGGNKNQSLSNDIIRHCIRLLKPDGYLCFVTPNNWMTYNSNNETLKDLLSLGRFIVIDNDAKKYFPGVGSSFTIFIWQKNTEPIKTLVKNNFLCKDKQFVVITKNLKFIPLYLSQDVLNIVTKVISATRNKFDYRCDLHNFTQKHKLRDAIDKEFRYETIHTVRKTRYANFKQNIYDRWIIVVPLSTYYIPYIRHNVNVTQSVGYIDFETQKEANRFLDVMTKDWIKLIVHLTRYGNFNNIMVLRHIDFEYNVPFTATEQRTINRLVKLIKY